MPKNIRNKRKKIISEANNEKEEKKNCKIEISNKRRRVDEKQNGIIQSLNNSDNSEENCPILFNNELEEKFLVSSNNVVGEEGKCLASTVDYVIDKTKCLSSYDNMIDERTCLASSDDIVTEERTLNDNVVIEEKGSGSCGDNMIDEGKGSGSSGDNVIDEGKGSGSSGDNMIDEGKGSGSSGVSLFDKGKSWIIPDLAAESSNDGTEFEYYDDCATPYDLSTKSKEGSETNNRSPKERSEKKANEDENDISRQMSDMTSQELFLAHLSKIQQHFISNLIQYQANFIAHYNQIQQQLMANGNAEAESKVESAECPQQDEICSEASRSNSPEPGSNILGNLLSVPLYPNLLPITGASGSPSPAHNGSTPFISSTALSLSYLAEKESDSPVNAGQRKRLRPLRMKAQEKMESSFDRKYSALESLIGSSKEKSSNDNDLNDDYDLLSSLHYKRKRIAFSAKQYELLQTTFDHNNFPEPGDQQCIARQLRAPYRSIKMWFQNKRANARKKLLPGEKGSGRTMTGEKIPGDTDTRFYCDKCPSAFICQKYLNNHLHAHTLYVKSCPKCHVIFTHDCLLTTHMMAKCERGKRVNVKEAVESPDVDDDILNLKFLFKDKAINGDLPSGTMDINKDDDENLPKIDPLLLCHLNSSLPLLTLLQIQKKQEEQQNKDEDSDDNVEGEGEEHEPDVEEEKRSLDEEFSEDVKSLNNKPAPKDVPPLIPSEFINSDCISSKFAILRQLLTNYKTDNDNDKMKSSIDEESANNCGEMDNEISEPNYQLPQNIPEHLCQLLANNTNGLSHSLKLMGENDEGSLTPPGCGKKAAKRKSESLGVENGSGTKFVRGPKAKRLRRRTTVFTETQHRVLYLHFTHCNFPDPGMFRILSKLTGLTPHVIKIWFQNERSRQRRQVSASEEAAKDKKPYRCRDCGVEFAMPAFLVKHCMRHIPTDNVTSQARKCPICMVEFETQKLHSHFMASHNLSINMDEDGMNENNICHLCLEKFSDLNTLSIHKNEHLTETHYGDPPQCPECKTTFVNVLCLEAHMATHHKYNWDHLCHKCKMKFYDKVLLESHLMTHTISTISNTIPEGGTNSVASNPCADSCTQARYVVSVMPTSCKEESDEKPQCPENMLSNNAANVSLKFIPIKFIPITTANSSLSPPNATNSSVSPSSSLVTVIAPQFLTMKDNVTLGINGEKLESGDTQKVLNSPPATTDVIHKILKKRVPNLIPIPNTKFTSRASLSLPNGILQPTSAIADSFESQPDAGDVPPTTDVKDSGKCLAEKKTVNVAGSGDESSESTSVLLYTPYASEYRKRRRTPTHFNSGQRDILEAYYKYDNFPDPGEQLQLSEYLSVPYSVIKTWFQNTRKNHRKHLKEAAALEVGGPFECSECHVCFVSRVYIESHLRQHQDTQPFNCPMCHLQFPHKTVFDIHVKMGCTAKKLKKKHDQIRQFSVIARLKSPSTDSEISLTDEYTKLHISNESASNIKIVSVKHVELTDMKVAHLREVKENGTEPSSDSANDSCFDIPYKSCPYCTSKFVNQFYLKAHIKNVHQGPSSHGKDLTGSEERRISKSLGATRKLSLSEYLNLFDSSTSGGLTTPQKCVTNVKSGNITRTRNAKLKKSITSFLKLHYAYNNFPTSSEIDLMSKKLGVLRETVAHWFQKQRARERKGNSVGYNPPHQCNSCSSIFVHSEALKDHQESVHNPVAISIQFVCPVENCHMKFPNSVLLQTHQMSHEESMNEGKELRSLSGFLEAHYMENNFPSPMVEGFIAQRLNVEPMYIHGWFKERRKQHQSEIETRLNGTITPAEVKLRNGEDSEVKLRNGEDSEVKLRNGEDSEVKLRNGKDSVTARECEFCNSAFLTQNVLFRHQKIHLNGFPLVCFECLTDFSNSLVFETHLLVHGISCTDIFSLHKVIKLKSSLKFKYTFLQLQVLCIHFKHNNYAKKEEVKLLSRRLKIPMKHINNWYKSQRSRDLSSRGRRGKMSTLRNSIEDSGLSCVSCSSEFISSESMRNHLWVHKMAYIPLACDICSMTFCHQVIRDTHSLLHYSGLGLKARAKTLEKDLKNSLKKLISDCKDASIFSCPKGVVSERMCFYESDEEENEENELISPNPESSSHLPSYLNGKDSSILQIDCIDEDAGMSAEEEDDELKLVIDE